VQHQSLSQEKKSLYCYFLLINAESVFDVMQFDFFDYDQRNHLMSLDRRWASTSR